MARATWMGCSKLVLFISYSTVPAVQTLGYKDSMDIFAIVTGVLGGMAIPAYFFGKRIREVATKYIWRMDEEAYSS